MGIHPIINKGKYLAWNMKIYLHMTNENVNSATVILNILLFSFNLSNSFLFIVYYSKSAYYYEINKCITSK